MTYEERTQAYLKRVSENTQEYTLISLLSNMPQRGEDIAVRMGLKIDNDNRQFRKIVESLRDKGIPICTDKPYGYYLGTPDEGKAEAKKLRHRAYSLLRRAERMESFDPDQIEMEDL